MPEENDPLTALIISKPDDFNLRSLIAEAIKPYVVLIENEATSVKLYINFTAKWMELDLDKKILIYLLGLKAGSMLYTGTIIQLMGSAEFRHIKKAIGLYTSDVEARVDYLVGQGLIWKSLHEVPGYGIHDHEVKRVCKLLGEPSDLDRERQANKDTWSLGVDDATQ